MVQSHLLRNPSINHKGPSTGHSKCAVQEEDHMWVSNIFHSKYIFSFHFSMNFFKHPYTFLPKSLSIYFYSKGKETERYLPLLASFPKCLQWQEMGQAETSSQEAHLGLPSVWQGPRYVNHHLLHSRKLHWKLKQGSRTPGQGSRQC